jgi:hypothetical protein
MFVVYLAFTRVQLAVYHWLGHSVRTVSESTPGRNSGSISLG